jgi:hypothetical protein
VNDPDDHDRVRLRQVVDGVGAVERDTKARGKLVARGTGERKVPQWLKGLLDRIDKTGRDRLRRFECERRPDFGEVGFGRVG